MKEKSYKKGWLYYRLTEMNPLLDIWYEAAEFLGYYPKWAEYKFLETNGVNVNTGMARKNLKELLGEIEQNYLKKLCI